LAASVGERIVEGGEQSEVTELWTFMQRAWRQLTAPCYPADLIPSHTRHNITVVIFCWHILLISESMDHHDSEIMDDRSID